MTISQCKEYLQEEEAKRAVSEKFVIERYRSQASELSTIQEKEELKKLLHDKLLYKSNVVEVHWPLKPNRLLKDFRLVDTPGLVQNLIGEVKVGLQEYYHKADGVIWLLDATVISSQKSRKLLDELNESFQQIGGRTDNIIAVLNSIDKVRRLGGEVAVDDAVREAKRLFGDLFQDIIPLSAKEACSQAGNYHYWGYLSGGDASTGVLKSQNFTLGGNGQVSFLVGGGCDIDKLYVSFVRASDGQELFRSTDPGIYWNWQGGKGETEGYTKRSWDATQYIGTSMFIKVVDERTDGWGHINGDDFIVPVQAWSSDTQAPTAPLNLTATGTTTSTVPLNWTASTDNVGVTDYLIYRNGVEVSTSTTTSYTDTGLTAGTSYAYTVKARDLAGNVSAPSNSISATTQAAQVAGGLQNHYFESGNLNGWTIVSGNAFSNADVTSDTNWGWGDHLVKAVPITCGVLRMEEMPR
jgi:hypothetical protein